MLNMEITVQMKLCFIPMLRYEGVKIHLQAVTYSIIFFSSKVLVWLWANFFKNQQPSITLLRKDHSAPASEESMPWGGTLLEKRGALLVSCVKPFVLPRWDTRICLRRNYSKINRMLGKVFTWSRKISRHFMFLVLQFGEEKKILVV